MEAARIRERLKKQLPDAYRSSVAANELFPSLTNALTLGQVFFGDKTDKAIRDFIEVLAKSNLEYVEAALRAGSAPGVALDEVVVRLPDGRLELKLDIDEIGSMRSHDLDDALMRVVNAMYEEVESHIESE